MVRDDNGQALNSEALSREITSADVLFVNGVGWGFRPRAGAHQFPFDYRPGTTSEINGAASPSDRESAYFKAVLEHIAPLVLKKPPHLRKKR